MAELVAEKRVCEKCGVDVRENTAFCYNCGDSVLPRVSTTDPNGGVAEGNAKAALDDLAAKFKIDDEEDGRLAKAAAQRRKARVSNRKSGEYEWRPADESSNLLFILLTVAIAVTAAAAVGLTVFWK